MIDMSTVAPPDVVQPLDFEALFSELKAEILARLPEFRLDPDHATVFHGGHVIGIESLHLRWGA